MTHLLSRLNTKTEPFEPNRPGETATAAQNHDVDHGAFTRAFQNLEKIAARLKSIPPAVTSRRASKPLLAESDRKQSLPAQASNEESDTDPDRLPPFPIAQKGNPLPAPEEPIYAVITQDDVESGSVRRMWHRTASGHADGETGYKRLGPDGKTYGPDLVMNASQPSALKKGRFSFKKFQIHHSSAQKAQEQSFNHNRQQSIFASE